MTGLAVSERYIVAQYFMEPRIDVFDRKSLKLLHKLEGRVLFMTPKVSRRMINQFRELKSCEATNTFVRSRLFAASD